RSGGEAVGDVVKERTVRGDPILKAGVEFFRCHLNETLDAATRQPLHEFEESAPQRLPIRIGRTAAAPRPKFNLKSETTLTRSRLALDRGHRVYRAASWSLYSVASARSARSSVMSASHCCAAAFNSRCTCSS